MMPKLDGIEVVRELARRECRSQLILISGVDRKVLESAARLATAHGLHVAATMSKPIRPVELQGVLSRIPKQQGDAARKRAKQPQYVPSVKEVRTAIEMDELVVHFQPQVQFTGGALTGVEALVRWQHPEHGLLYPDSFVSIAENNGLSLPLTYRVLRQALSRLGAMASPLPPDATLSVNVPGIALQDVSFPEAIVSRLAGVSKPKVILEVTETSVSAELVSSLDVLTRLRMKGIGLSIDDFGTGQSGLERLHQLPFTELKIDMTFVRAAEKDSAARTIVESSIALAKSLGMTVVAEGVENESIWRWLAGRGCDVAQGYYVSRPIAAENLGPWVGTWRAPTS